jgi:SRSO17 transposase
VADRPAADLREVRWSCRGGVLIVDEAGFVKQGTRSCGVAHPYTGTTGATATAQVGVFRAAASNQGAAGVAPDPWDHRLRTRVPDPA